MELTSEHYNELLGLVVGWSVTKVDIEHAGGRVDIHVEAVEDAYHCPCCDELAEVYDVGRLRSWRHKDVMQMKCYISCRLPRVKCPACKVKTVAAPWADRDRRQTRLFEAHVVDVLQVSKSIDEASRLLGISWKTTFAIMERAVERGMSRRKEERPRHIGLDEKQYKKGHVYMTLLNDLEGGCVLDMAEGRTIEAAEGLLLKSLTWEQARAVEAVAMDMWGPYRSAVEHVLGHAAIVYDRFHVAGIMNRAVDQVRRAENKLMRRIGDDRLVKTKWLWLGTYLSGAKRVLRDSLRKAGLKVGRAWSIKDALRRLWEYRYKAWALKYFNWWYGWARRSQLDPVKRAAATLKRHLDGIMAYFDHRISNAVSEALNAKIQAVKANAKGFRSFKNMRIAILFNCGKLDLSEYYPHTLCR